MNSILEVRARTFGWAFLTLVVMPVRVSVAQTADQSDSLVDLAAGIKSYIIGISEGVATPLQQALDHFTAALESDPNNQPALLFRALTHGELGFHARVQKLNADSNAKLVQFLLDWRANPEREQALIAERDNLQSQLEDPDILGAERMILLSRLGIVENRIQYLEAEKTRVGSTPEQLQEDLQGHVTNYQKFTLAERTAYVNMMDDVARLVSLWDNPDAIVRLLDAVSTAKVARLYEEEALWVVKKEATANQATASVAELRRHTQQLMEKAAQVLELALEELPQSDRLTRVRAEFFLGVIRFRQGVPRRHSEDGTERQRIEPARLAEAEEIMRNIATSEENGSLRNWRSYASLYLGLIIPFRATEARDAETRDEILDEAQHWLTEAARLDTMGTQADEPKSASDEVIPELVWDQRKELEDLSTRAPAGRQLRRDISIGTYFGVHRDTNVVLLGERTDLPRGIGKDSDFGFTTGVNLGFTWDVDERLTVGFQGRVSQLWHAEIDEFDEQDYGGSAALLYEAIPQTGSFGPVQLHLQYDYDYTLLGRDGFLSSNSLRPSLQIFWADRRAHTELYFRYQIRDYSEPLSNNRLDRDGEYFSLGVSQSVKLLDMAAWYEKIGLEPWGHPGDVSLEQTDPDYPQRFLQPFVLFEYSWDQTAGTEFDLQAFLFAVGARVPLPLGIDMHASVDFEWEDYQNGSMIDFHRRTRRDFIQRYQVAFSRTFVLQEGQPENRYTPDMDRILMTLRAHAIWTHDDSNVVDRLGRSVFEYDRTLYGLSVAFTFN